MAADVRAGLTSPFKELSPRYFYDERGSELFEQITELDEYYPTRCEREILQTRSADICEAANRPASLIELGSGSARKTRVLLDAMRKRRLPRDLLPGRHLRGDHPRHRRADRRRVRRDQRPRPRLRLRVRPRARAGRRPAGDRPARRHDRQLRPAPAGRLPAHGSPTCSIPRTVSCSAPTWSRTPPSWRPPTTTRRASPRSSTRTSSRSSTASSRRTSTSIPSSTSPAGTRRTSGSTFGCARWRTRS